MHFFFLFHVPGKLHLGEEEGLEDESEGKSDVATAPFTGQLQRVVFGGFSKSGGVVVLIYYY